MKKRNRSLEAFTLAEGATHVENCNDCRRYAFTLAEVLITLGIIGVVAAVALPALITNINDRANSERQANIAQKITQAMEQMRAHGELVKYSSTDDFVDVLQKYLKITKRCDANNIADCWTTSVVSVTNSNGETLDYDVSSAKTRKKLLKYASSDGNNVGLVLADGASLILTYDPATPSIDIGDKVLASRMTLSVGKNKTKEYSYTTNVTGAIDFVMDVNGKKGPNKERYDNKMYDIRPFRLASFSDITQCEYGSQGCIAYIGNNYTEVDCSEAASTSTDETIKSNYDNYCGDNPSKYATDYWAGANKACEEVGMMLPNQNKLKDIWQNKAEYAQIASNTNWFWASDKYDRISGKFINFSNGRSAYGEHYVAAKGHVLCIKK